MGNHTFSLSNKDVSNKIGRVCSLSNKDVASKFVEYVRLVIRMFVEYVRNIVPTQLQILRSSENPIQPEHEHPVLPRRHCVRVSLEGYHGREER